MELEQSLNVSGSCVKCVLCQRGDGHPRLEVSFCGFVVSAAESICARFMHARGWWELKPKSALDAFAPAIFIPSFEQVTPVLIFTSNWDMRSGEEHPITSHLFSVVLRCFLLPCAPFLTMSEESRKKLKMDKDTHFVVKLNSRCDATLFHSLVQKQLKKECSLSGFAECESASHWKANGGLTLTVHFEDPMTVEEQRDFPSGVMLSGNCFLFFAHLMICQNLIGLDEVKSFHLHAGRRLAMCFSTTTTWSRWGVRSSGQLHVV